MIYFAGDFHLGIDGLSSSREREMKICRWLDQVSKDAEHIYLMGDLFDFWFEYKTVVPKGCVRFLAKLAETSQLCPITVFRGNHDAWMKSYLEQECGATVISGPLEVDHYGKTLYLHHGDGLGPGDRWYKVLRKLFHAKTAQFFFRWLHPDVGTALAQNLSRNSRKKQRPPVFTQNEQELLYTHCENLIKKSHHADYYVLGHRHLALDLVLSNKSRYINPGTWLGPARYARLEPSGEMTLCSFN
ncbi:MAG: UDP-2,3-diacylglucosamine diphosphatase [Bacteroidetes bacterium]|nr:UDP-2,3-diacylglucosamine diphosphatase [Bacteroidota bacterium]